MALPISFISLTPAVAGSTEWEQGIREALAQLIADKRLTPHFAVVNTLEQLRRELRAHGGGLIHIYGHAGALLVGDGDSELSASGAFAKLSGEQLDEAEAGLVLDFVVLTGSLSRSRAEPGPVAGARRTLAMSGSLEGGPALEFSRAFYTALAAGLDIETAFAEGKLSTSDPFDEGFRVYLYEGSELVVAARDPFDELRALKDSARAISARLREVQRQLSLSSGLAKNELLAGRYLLQECAAIGGFTEVWRAYDRNTGTIVAVKVLHPAWAADPGRVKRFARSALDMDELRFAGIAEVLSPMQEATEQGRRFYVMRWYVGGDLQRAVREGLDHDAALRACADAIEALTHTHHSRYIHRDVKPSHVLLDEQGRGFLCDFDSDTGDSDAAVLRGVAAPPYAAPELHPHVDGRADLYAAAMCVMFALRGATPDVLDPLAALEEIEDCTEDLHDALQHALAPKREQRRTTCERLAAAVRAYVETPTSRRRRSPAGWIRQGEDRYGRWAVLAIAGVEQRMRWIERGKFSMGSDNAADMSRDFEGWRRPTPVHTVTLTHGFWMAETECTQAFWAAVMGDNPSAFHAPDRPVESVSWHDVQRFLTQLQELVGGPAFMVPTEAQWEYACRADTRTQTYAGPTRPLSDIAWYSANSQETHEVRQKGCNPWGLHDTLGNVWEWCEDVPRVYQGGAVVDPVGLSRPGEDTRVLRGGGWYSSEHFGLRAADRMAEHPSTRDPRVGFRLARRP